MRIRKSARGVGVLLRPYWGHIALLSGLAITQSLLQVAVAVIMRYVIDAALSAPGQLMTWGFVLAACLLGQLLVHSLLSWYSGSTADKFTARLRGKLIRSAAYSQDARLQAFHSGALLSRGMDDVNTVCDGAMNALPTMIGQLTCLMATFGVVLFMYPGLAAILAGVAFVIGSLAAWLRPLLKRRHREVRLAEDQVIASMQEDLQQLELIQSLQIQSPILGRLGIRLKNSLSAKFRRRLWSVGSNSIVNAASYLGTGAVLLWGAVKVASGGLSYGSLTSILQLLSLFRSPVLSLSALWTKLMAVEVASERLQETLMTEKEAKVLEPDSMAVHAVVFQNVTFRYPGEEHPVLQDFSARFPLDRWVCLTGCSGKGKTTLFKLILGLYTPQEGEVYLETDRGDIRCSEDTRYLFAYVPQDYALFSGTIRENLELVACGNSEEKRRQALKLALGDFVWEMSAGEETQVRENNAGLSKGQFQRLAIARAILMERPVILLDECTSALDSGTESAVLQNLHSLQKGAILVTHRPEMLENLTNVEFIPMSQE